MAGKTNLTLTTFSGKKLLSKAHTSLAASDSEESASSAVQLSAQTIFGDTIPNGPNKTLNIVQDGSVEYVEFDLTPINESFFDANDFDTQVTAQPAGHHAYFFSLKNTYQTDTDNPSAGNGVFKNGNHLTGTLGGLQIVSPAFSTAVPNPYICTIYSGSRDLEDQIPLTDEIDWYVDYYNGILYVQDFDSNKVPTRAKAFIYVGQMVSSKIGSGGGGGSSVGWIGSGAGGISTTGSVFFGTDLANSNSSDIFFSNTGEAIFNQQGNNADFRVESVNKENAIKIDADQDKVLFLSGGANSSFDEASAGDVSFYVSGSTTGKNSSTGGVAVFGGDVVISGTLYDANGNQISGGGGSGTPGGANTQIQFNDGGSFGGIPGATTDGSAVTFGDSAILVGQDITHAGDTDTKITFGDDAIGFTAGGEQLLTISEAGTDIVTVGDGGDVDFRVRTENDDNTLYVEGSTDRIGVGTNSPASIVHIAEAAPTLTLQRENNSNASSIDFLGALGNTANSIAHDSSTNDLVFKTFNGSSVEEIFRAGDHYGTSNRQVIFLSGSSIAASDTQPRQASDISFFVSGAIGSKGTGTKGTAVLGGDVVSSGSLHALDKIHLHGSSPSQKAIIESYDSNGSVILSASNGDIKLDAGSGVWHFEEDGSEQLKIETSPDSNDIKFVKTNDNGQFYFNIESGGSEISALQASTDGTRGKVGINFQSGGPTNLLDIKADSNDQGFTVRNASNKPVVQFSLENVNYGRLIFQDEASIGITQIGSRPGMDHYFHTSGSTKFGIGTRTPGHLLDVRSDSNSKQVFLLSGSGAASSPDEKNYGDINFFVSGSVGSKNSNNKGTALFGGDLVVSGTIYNAAGSPVDGGVNYIGGVGSNNQMITADGSGDIVAESNISFNGSQLEVTGNILPGSDKVYNLGGPNNRFANIYTGDLHLRNERGHWQIVEEADALTVINRLTGKRYKMVLEPYDE